MYKINNLKFRVCIVIHETRYTKHETRRFRVSTSQLYSAVFERAEMKMQFYLLLIFHLCIFITHSINFFTENVQF